MRIKVNKTNNGITLIALVITIIVLLILAGVTIATLMGDNRNINKSNRGKREDKSSKCRGTSKVSSSSKYRNRWKNKYRWSK